MSGLGSLYNFYTFILILYKRLIGAITAAICGRMIAGLSQVVVAARLRGYGAPADPMIGAPTLRRPNPCKRE
jgi:hypothetical protein